MWGPGAVSLDGSTSLPCRVAPSPKFSFSKTGLASCPILMLLPEPGRQPQAILLNVPVTGEQLEGGVAGVVLRGQLEEVEMLLDRPGLLLG